MVENINEESLYFCIVNKDPKAVDISVERVNTAECSFDEYTYTKQIWFEYSLNIETSNIDLCLRIIPNRNILTSSDFVEVFFQSDHTIEYDSTVSNVIQREDSYTESMDLFEYIPDNDSYSYTFRDSALHAIDFIPDDFCGYDITWIDANTSNYFSDEVLTSENELTYAGSQKNPYMVLISIDKQYEDIITLNPNTLQIWDTVVTKASQRFTEGKYTFNGLFYDSDYSQSISSDSPITNGGVLYAKRVRNYDITYNLDGGKASNNPKTITQNDSCTLNNPTKSGYRFNGWKETDSEETPKLSYFLTNLSYDISLTAVWEKLYTVTFNYGGVRTSKKEYISGEEIIIPTDVERQYYTFDGWDMDNISHVGDSNLTINAIYTPIKYCITYVSNGGEEIEPFEYTVEDHEIVLKTLQREDDRFIGWFTDEGFKNKISTVDCSFGNVTVYARWLHQHDGDGTKKNPFCITEAEQLLSLQSGYWYILLNDLSIDKTLVNNDITMNSSIDGDGYTIDFETDGSNPLFDSVNSGCTITNLNVSVKGNIAASKIKEISIFVGKNYGTLLTNSICADLTGSYDMLSTSRDMAVFVNVNYGTIDACDLLGAIEFSGSKTPPSQSFSGICITNEGLIQNCSNSASITSCDASGICHENKGKIIKCTNSGTIYASMDRDGCYCVASGIALLNYGTIEQCENEGIISSKGSSLSYSYASGISGYNYEDARINSCINNGSVQISGIYYKDGYYSNLSGGISAWNQGEISDCQNYGSFICSDSKKTPLIGGIVANNFNKVYNCINYSNSISIDSVDEIHIGLIVGYNRTGGSIDYCRNLGDFISIDLEGTSGVSLLGGIACKNDSDITRCYNAKNMTCCSNYCMGLGGITASNSSKGSIKNCYNNGNLYSYDSSTDYGSKCGGITGYNYGSISYCYNIGTINSKEGDWAGGITGYGSNCNYTYCCWLYDTSVKATDGDDNNETISGIDKYTTSSDVINYIKNNYSSSIWDYTGNYPKLKQDNS